MTAQTGEKKPNRVGHQLAQADCGPHATLGPQLSPLPPLYWAVQSPMWDFWRQH